MCFSTGNGQPREPALCQLYRHTSVPYSPPPSVVRYTNRPSRHHQMRGTKRHTIACAPLSMDAAGQTADQLCKISPAVDWGIPACTRLRRNFPGRLRLSLSGSEGGREDRHHVPRPQLPLSEIVRDGRAHHASRAAQPQIY